MVTDWYVLIVHVERNKASLTINVCVGVYSCIFEC